MTIATLIKITSTRKLMMKINEKTFTAIDARLTDESHKKKFPQNRLATFTLDGDDGEESHFVMISLDKYDKQNMPKFERLLKKEVAVQYRLKPYDFIPEGETERRQGINLELVSIRMREKGKNEAVPPHSETEKASPDSVKIDAEESVASPSEEPRRNERNEAVPLHSVRRRRMTNNVTNEASPADAEE